LSRALDALKTIIKKIMAKVNLDIAPRLDIVCKRGDSFKLVVDFQTPMPLDTSATYILKVAEDSEASPLSATFTYDITNGEASNSKLTIEATSTVTLGIEPGLYVYDLQVTDTNADVFPAVGGAPYEATLLYGTFRVNDDVNIS